MRKLLASASAPLKVIISGEHGVVHGTPAITLTLEPSNEVDLYEEEGSPQLVIESDRGRVVIDESGEVVGGENKEHFLPLAAMVKFMVLKHQLKFNKKLVAVITSAGAPKGLGTGSSIAAALASALFHYAGRQPRRGARPEEDELWMAVQAADEVSHGARPSGVDAMSVIWGPTKLVRVVEGGKVAWKFEDRNVVLPQGSKLMVVDTFKGERASTGDMIKVFANSNKLLKEDGSGMKTLMELGEADKGRLRPFEHAFEEIVSHLHESGDARKLGEAMKKNHLLLSKAGVSTAEMEEVIAIAEKNGAYGAKLTGAGGKGGAVIVLAPENASGLEAALESAGYRIFVGKPVARGAKTKAQ